MWRAGCGLWRQEHTKERYEETGSFPSKRGGSPLDEEEEDPSWGRRPGGFRIPLTLLADDDVATVSLYFSLVERLFDPSERMVRRRGRECVKRGEASDQ